MSDIAQEQASSLVQHFAEAASAVLSQIAGAPLKAQPVSLDDAIEAATLIRVELTGALQGVCEIALSALMSARFAALLTGETAEPAAEVDSDTREAAAELIQQICGSAADRLRSAFGPLELKPQPAARDSASGARQFFLITGGIEALEFELHILRLVPEPIESQPSTTQSETSSEPIAQPSKPVAAERVPQPSNRNLDLLLDIELGATLRFGTRQILLRDVIELCSGSVVELDSRVEQPVDLLIDGRLIAQGEVVIVEGNYGLRVTKVAAQGEKIACLPVS